MLTHAVTLPQLTRREFLKRAALAVWVWGLWNSPSEKLRRAVRQIADKNTFAFFSDTHIAADATLKHSNVNMADNLAACVRELAAWPVRPPRSSSTATSRLSPASRAIMRRSEVD